MKLKTIDRKKFRVSNKLKKVSSPDRFRLSITRSIKNISAQIIDDVKNITLLSASSVEKDIKIVVEKQTIVKVIGSDKQQVGMVVSQIKSFRKPEPYKGKGIREKGQHIRRKEGKKK